MKHDYSKYIHDNITELNNTILNGFNLTLEYNEMTGEMKEFSTMYLIYKDPINNEEEKIKAPSGNNHFNFERIIIFYKELSLLNNILDISNINSEDIKQCFTNCFYKF